MYSACSTYPTDAWHSRDDEHFYMTKTIFNPQHCGVCTAKYGVRLRGRQGTLQIGRELDPPTLHCVISGC
jgi:hypothetical protein